MNFENKHSTNQKHCAWKTPTGHIAGTLAASLICEYLHYWTTKNL